MTMSGMVNTGLGQELSPRAYWPTPKGTRVVVLGYSYNAGDVLTDPSLPITGVDSRIHSGFVAYVHSLSLCGRTANIIADLSYVKGSTEGLLDNNMAQRNLAGITDLSVSLSINILGAPTMDIKAFQALRANPHPIVAASLKILAPTGAYDADKVINISANRWAAKAELGFINPLTQKWLLELELGAWFFRQNKEFVGTTRKQQPIVTTEVHLVRRLRPGCWAALDLNFFTGGRTTVGGNVKPDLQRNSRMGCTLAYPFSPRYALKTGYSRGLVTASGSNFQAVFVGFSLLL